MMAKVVIVCNQCNCIVLKTVKTIRKTRKNEMNVKIHAFHLETNDQEMETKLDNDHCK